MYTNLLYKEGATCYFTSKELTEAVVEITGDKKLIMPNQTHTVNVAVVVTGEEDLRETDAVITQNSDIAIGIRTADCVPILLYSSDIRAVAAIHAGWRGTLGGIVDNSVKKLVEMGASVTEMRAIFGPCICQECYEVSEELAGKFSDSGFATCIKRIKKGEGVATPHLDLQAVNRERMLGLGLKSENIVLTGYCTRHSETPAGGPLFPSWRRHPGETERLFTIIHL